MSIPARLTRRLRPLWSSATHPRSFSSKTATEEWPQRTPLGSYYETILRKPTQYRRPEPLSNSTQSETTLSPDKQPSPRPDDNSTTASSASSFSNTTPPAETRPAPGEQTPEERMRSIFGSRVLSPEEIASRTAAKKSQSTYIAGILVPPQPQEPDNCCMSGCVNCVWERYREDMEEWTLKNTEAQNALAAQSGTMDSDGGGSESNWVPGAVPGGAKIAKDLWAKDVFESVPVGIREFMKQEKRIKQRHERDGQVKN